MSGFLSILLVAIVIIIVWKLYLYFGNSGKNPFEHDGRKPREPYITDQKKRNEILKQNFKPDKIPKDLDAIIIGSGIGGLSVGALLSKVGKKVLILEQHDQAGGSCHTFIDKGYEFDVGIHYIGDMHHQSMSKTFVDQISDGQIEWEPLSDEFDTVVFVGEDGNKRRFPILSGKERQIDNLKKHFPEEKDAIDKYYELVKKAHVGYRQSFIFKFLPVWLVNVLISTNLIHKMTDFYKLNEKTVKEVVDSLTENQTLRDIFSYCYGDYGTPPSRAGFPIQALLTSHYSEGASYPVGGSSEIAFNIIPVIERNGGKVLVRAEVLRILFNSNNEVTGVRVKHGTQEHDIPAPLVVSNAGIYNTFLKFLPDNVTRESRLLPVTKKKRAIAGLSVFVGLDATAEELELPPKKNFWVYSGNDIDKVFLNYLECSKEECEEMDVPLMFISFPSTKDPTWNDKFPGKSTMTVVTLSKYEWFEEWEKEPCTRRSDDYEEKKKTIGWKCIDQAIKMFPKIKDNIDYVSVGSPLTNNFYLGTTKGEFYGLDHDATRFSPKFNSILRPETDISGLYLSGQDVLSAGFMGALYGGLVCASQILKRNLLNDLVKIHKELKYVDKKKE